MGDLKLCSVCWQWRRTSKRTACGSCYRRLSAEGRVDELPTKRRSVDQWFALVDQSAGTDECWPWPGPVSPTGYGYVDKDWIHRVAYVRAHGEIPAGHEVDHVCHGRDLTCVGDATCLHRRCINPAHLEAVTHAENVRRQRARITLCPEGHELVMTNEGYRRCLTCRRDQARARRATTAPGTSFSRRSSRSR